jgi:prevent-host-death family protein
VKYSKAVKPISYFKAHAAEMIREVSDNKKTIIITQNGEAKAILQDVRSYEQLQESLALLKILALSAKSLKRGKFKSLEKSFEDIRTKLSKKVPA